MKEFKLIDLNKGKILELGEFYFAGDAIFIKNAINTIPQQYNSKNENGSPIVCLMGEEYCKTPLSQSTHTKLIPILEKTGAELFGDRYVLTDNLHKFVIVEYNRLAQGDLKKTIFRGFEYKNVLFDDDMIEIVREIDLLKEYPLLLKGEPNKFEEFCELVK